MHVVDTQRNPNTWVRDKACGQTRGLSNLEMKYVGKLAIIGALLEAKQA